MRSNPTLSVVALLLALTACSATEPEKGDTVSTTSEELVCNLISPDLVKSIIGDDPVKTSGGDFDAKSGEFVRCRVVNDKDGTIVMQLTIGKADPQEWRPKLEHEMATADEHCTKRYESDPGFGYGCTYEKGLWRFGAAVHVLTDDHLIRATVYNWPDATPEERLALAEDVARDMEKNYSKASKR